ncbi:MAG: hypothetical protein L3V56_08370 [Candidatus Magnetoovum sp. WYHC-5]|nr:hypothetical protein [Candidatus Magnetoovum sp. WYHC-5]
MNSKIKGIVYLFSISMLCAMLLVSLSTPCKAQSTGEIRKPTGSPTEFWDKFLWTELSPAEQAAWKKLGWNETNWESPESVPISAAKQWKQLSDDERSAALSLGYNENSWNKE